MEIISLFCPIVRISLSASLVRSKGMEEIHLAWHYISSAVGAVDNMLKVTPNNFLTKQLSDTKQLSFVFTVKVCPRLSLA